MVAQGLVILKREIAAGSDLRKALDHPDEFVGMPDRQRPQQYGVEHAEDYGRRSDAEGEKSRQCQRTPRTSPQHSSAETQIGHQRIVE